MDIKRERRLLIVPSSLHARYTIVEGTRPSLSAVHPRRSQL